MKKILILILALLLAASMSVTAFAAEPDATLTGDNKSTSVDVYVTYEDATTTPTVYSVDVEWQEMNFNYVSAGTMVWKPETHEYEHQTTGAWESDRANIKVTNHSNAAVDVTVIYTANGTTGVTGTIANGTFTLETAEGKTVAEAPTKTATFTVGGVPTDKNAENLKVGSITVSFE